MEAYMTSNKAVPVLVIYRLKKGAETQFRPLLAKHWPVLNNLGLVTQETPKFWRTHDHENEEKISFIETFEWKNEEAPGVAQQTPEVMRTWEAMGSSIEKLEIMHLEPVRF
jgi:hypothetical protein